MAEKKRKKSAEREGSADGHEVDTVTSARRKYQPAWGLGWVLKEPIAATRVLLRGVRLGAGLLDRLPDEEDEVSQTAEKWRGSSSSLKGW